MEKMPFQPRPEAAWRLGLPELTGSCVTLREVRPEDTPELWAKLWLREAVQLFVPLPRTPDELRRMLSALIDARAAGSGVTFTVYAPDVIGLICVRALEPSFETAECAFAFGPGTAGTPAPIDALILMRDFLFDTVGTRRLESRTVVNDDQRIAYLQRLGMLQESVLRRSLPVAGGYADQILWAVVKDDGVRDQNHRGSSM